VVRQGLLWARRGRDRRRTGVVAPIAASRRDEAVKGRESCAVELDHMGFVIAER
jgi:hypothetical protein